ncbi:MAG: DNA internalization-related competence protein ComEC/Rec2 [Syntrophobacterales bacterium]|nr:DNA internalization-related competence protein ComEC/Rec2 [Syntrophobacterales bacterium]
MEIFGLSFLFGLYLPDLFPLWVVPIFTFILLGIILVINLSSNRNKWEGLTGGIALLGLLVAIGFRYYKTQEALERIGNFQTLIASFGEKSGESSPISHKILWEGNVESFVEKYPNKIRFVAKITKIYDGENDRGSYNGLKIYVFIKDPTREWKYGERFVAKSSLREYRDFRNPAPPFYQDLQKSRMLKGIHGYTFIDDDRDVAQIETPFSIIVRLLQWMDVRRQDFSDYLDKVISHPEGAYLKALTVGYRGFIDEEWKELTTKAGVQHLLAISGFHLAVVAFFSFCIVKLVLKTLLARLFLIVPEPILSGILSLPLVASYAVFTGLAVPTKRALFSIMLMLLGILVVRRVNFLTIFLVVAVVVLLEDLSLIYSPSFILSFGAVAAIKWVALNLRKPSNLSQSTTSKVNRWLERAGRGIFGVFWISLCVQVVLCPFLIYFFSRFCWAGIVANVFLVPYVGFFVLPLGLMVLLGFLVNPAVSDLFLGIVDLAIYLMILLIRFFGSWDWSVFWGVAVTLSPAVAKLCIVAYLVILGTMVYFIKRKQAPITVTKIAFIVFISFYQLFIGFFERRDNPRGIELVVFDVGYGNSTFVVLPDGRKILIDGGGITGSKFNVGMNIIAPAIIALGFRKADEVILSHYHYDHVAGLDFIIRAFPASRFIEPLCPPEDKNLSIVDLAVKRGLQIIPFKEAANEFSVDNNISLIHPPLDTTTNCRNLNDSSTVLKLRYLKTSIVIPSDIGKEILRKILPDISKKEGETLILVAPHHGRCSSFDERLYDKLSPDGVVVSTKRNKNVPCPALIEWCRRNNVPYFETFKDGAIKLDSDGKGWTLYGTDQRGRFQFLTRINDK